MARFGRKGNLSSFLFNKFTLIVILIMSAYIAVSVFERYTVEREMAGRRQNAEAEYEALEARQETLLEKVNYFRGDSGIESEIRRNFDVAKEGEQVVIIVDEEDIEEIKFSEGVSPEVNKSKPWYKFW